MLAGGAGRRMGEGSKPSAPVAGRPLIAWPLAALRGACDRLAVVCKPDTRLPELGEGVERWDEPAQPLHPLTGIVHALEREDGPVLVCAADMPFVDAAACAALLDAAAREPGARAIVAEAGERLQPVFGVYLPAALAQLSGAVPDAPLTRTIELLEPARVELPEAVVASVNTPEELAAAGARLSA